MYQNKLTELLQELSPKEWKAFEAFVASPIFNTSKKIIDLLEILKPYAPNFEAEKLTQTYLSTELFPEKKGDATKNLSNLTTRLLRLLEQFFAFQYWQDDENKQDNDLLRSLVARNKNKLAKQNLDKIAIKREKQVEKSFDFYDSQVLFLEQKYRYSLRQKMPTKWANLQDNSDALDEAYILKKLKYACLMRHREKVYNIKHDITLLSEILAVVETKNLCKNVAIEIYYTCFKMLETNEYDAAEKLTVLLTEKSDVLNETDLANLYGFLLLFYNRQSVKQYDKMLNIYLLKLEKGLLNDGKFLHHKNLNNLMICALKAQKFEFAEQLAARYKKQIEPKFAAIFYHFNMGKSAFYQKNYEQASRHFEQIESNTLFYELNRRVYVLKTYFLTNNIALYDSRKNSFRQFLRGNKAISKRHQQQRENFIKLLDRLYKIKDLRNKTDKRRLELLQQKIKQTKQLIEAEWLLEQIDSYLKK